ncbi:AbrB/MazE/SpoVT family DNA-binding domain-containing protein [Cohnella sp. CBP 2801]|uniref:AbrB/MazE/SpoVT family DNA-binding domain-containing protein n=1 Tax=Cohnella zeiphila TaxID=2761120 RepID=A0A7X0SPV6_9BACL|nr:AbrB/MazE/SpoVT family DNA-binding domain-containing protein [Cohnella zeiphila]
MKPTGMVRNLDPLGRVVLPKELRKTIGISGKDPVEMYTEGDWIVLEKAEGVATRCAACHSQEDLNQFKSIYLCESCIGELFDTVEVE